MAANVANLITTLQQVQLALTQEGVGSVSEQTSADLRAGIANLQKLAETELIEFATGQSGTVQGVFMSRTDAKPLRRQYKGWANDFFRAGPLKKMPSLYVSAHLVQKLLDRTTVAADYLEICLGKEDNVLHVMLAAVDKKGNRLDDPLKAIGGDDLISRLGPCPEPQCPDDLDN